MSSNKDALVSTTLLRQNRERVREELAGMRPYLTNEVAAMAERVLLEWEKAERDAAREFVETARAAFLTGWSADTLATHAKAIEETRTVPEEWRGLIAQRNSAGWAFVLSSIPVKRSQAA